MTVLRAPASTRRHIFIAVNMVMLHAWKRELDFLLASKNLSLCMEESLRERDFRKPTRNHDSHSDVLSSWRVPVLVPVRASPVPSVVRGSFVVKFSLQREREIFSNTSLLLFRAFEHGRRDGRGG